MKLLTARKLIGVAALVLLLGLSVSSGALGQGRGHGHGGFNNGFDKKCGKFVNCHDARDGRWDGRGPRRTSSWTRSRWSHSHRNYERRNHNRWHNNHWNRRH